MGQRIIIMAGGTGGHVFPALAVAQYLSNKGWDVSWIGTKKGLESKVVPAHGIEIDWLSVAGLRGKGLKAKVKNLLLLLKACWQALNILRRRKPDVVLGMGGYVAGPGGIVASLMGIPLVIHEQNRVPGTTNRLLMNRANKKLEAFPGSFSVEAEAIFTGNPLRTHFLDFPEKQYWKEDSERAFRILIIGGSQGAKILNDTVPPVVAKLKNVEVKHQAGTASYELVRKKYSQLPLESQVCEFIDDIASSYQWADMVICRAGAMTVSEIASAGIPAILVPLPNAIDDHQVANAKYLVDAGAALMLIQNSLSEASLLKAINEVKESLEEIGLAAKNMAKLDATVVVAEICAKEASS